MKAIVGLVLALVVALGGYVLYQKHKIEQAISGPAKELVSESMEKKGDVWHVEFVSKFDAPVDKVFEAFSKPEKGHDVLPENVLKSELVKEEGTKKTVEIVGKLDILPPGFKVQNLQTEYNFFPGERRITSRSLDFKLADLVAEYKFEATPDGKTLLRFTETSKDKGGIPVESVQKGALREMFVTQVRIANKAMGLTAATTKSDGGGE